MTPTVGSNRHWALGSWCYPWVRKWDRVVTCTLAGFLQGDASPRPWAKQERRCSSSWPQPRLASLLSNPPRSRLARCHLIGRTVDSTAHYLPRVAALIIFFWKDLTEQGLIICLFNIQQPLCLNTKGWQPNATCALKSLSVMKVVQRKTDSMVQLASKRLKGHVCPARICKYKSMVYYNTQTCFITTTTETAAATMSHMNTVVYTVKQCTGQTVYFSFY